MKYFTPELFVRLQQCESPDEFRTVNAQWELAVQQYGRQLHEIAPRLKGALRRLVKRGSLHDARVLDIGVSERKVTLVVREELARRLLLLTYSLVDAPVIDRDAFAEEHRTAPVLWLYDELDVDRETVFNRKRRVPERAEAAGGPTGDGAGGKPIFLHSILLSNGWEVRLRFYKLEELCAASLLGPGTPRERKTISGKVDFEDNGQTLERLEAGEFDLPR